MWDASGEPNEDTPAVRLQGPSSISSAQNPRFRAALSLREARERRRQGRILIDGSREIMRALDAGVTPVEAWIDPQRSGAWELTERVRSAGGSVVEGSADLMARLRYGDRGQGIVLVADARTRILDELDLPDVPLVCILEGLEKPGNVGAILRSADASGVDALVLTDPCTDLFNPNTIRASTGTVFTMPVAVASSGEVLEWLRARGVRIVAARLDASVAHTDVDLSGGVAIALGSEARGLSDAWAELSDVSVRIPMLGVADSLNVSTTAAVLFYEVLRQRRAQGTG